MDGDGLLPSLLLFLAAGAYYFLSAQTIINRGFVHPDVRQMVGLMCLSDSSFCVLSGAWSRRHATVGTKRAMTRKEVRRPKSAGLPRVALYALPVFDLFGLVVAFEAIRVAGSGFHQTVGGASIPIGTALNVLLLRTRFSYEQLSAIGVVMLGLAVKARALLSASADFPAEAFALVVASCFGYAMRGVVMEYLSTSANPPSGDRMTLQMSVTGLIVWSLYFTVRVLPNFDVLVTAPFAEATRAYGAAPTALLYVTHAASRGLTSKGMMGIVRGGGATALSLAQVTRASVIVVLSDVLFCASDARQCLDRAGAFSAALVVAGGALFAAAKRRAASAAALKRRRPLRGAAGSRSQPSVNEGDTSVKRRASDPRATSSASAGVATRRRAAAKK
jgi:hypothetical protein